MEQSVNEHYEWMIKHLKTFAKVTGNDNGGTWRIKWVDGAGDPLIYNNKNESIKFNVSDIMLAEYIVSLHNYTHQFIKEIEKHNEVVK